MQIKMTHKEFGVLDVAINLGLAAWPGYRYAITASKFPCFVRLADCKPIIDVVEHATYLLKQGRFVHVKKVNDDGTVVTGGWSQSLCDSYTNTIRYQVPNDVFEGAKRIENFDPNIMHVDHIGVWANGDFNPTHNYEGVNGVKYLEMVDKSLEPSDIFFLYNIRSK